MHNSGLSGLTDLPFADVIEILRRVGVIVVPIAVMLIVVGILYWRGQTRGAIKGGKRLREELEGKTTYPIASRCPKCGARRYSKAEDQEGALIVLFDRICSVCGTRYTPPIPRWLCVALIPCGGVIVVAGVVSWPLFQEMELGPVGSLISIMIALSGVSVSVMGIGKLRVQSARLPDADDELES